MLKIQYKDRRTAPIWIVEKRYTIGSSVNNHLVLAEPGISPLHARLLTENNSLILKDNHSDSGCFVNGQRVTEKLLLPGDTIRLGSVEFDILDPQETDEQDGTARPAGARWSLVSDSSWLAGAEYPLPDGRSIIGRSSNCDLVVPGNHLSQQHAELTIRDNLLHIRDLASANGTYINDKRVREGTLRPGDRLRLDVYSFRVVGPEPESSKPRPRRARAATAPLERRTPSSEPKQWKTKPTSPGNRIEPEAPKQLNWLATFSFLLLCGALGLMMFIILRH